MLAVGLVAYAALIWVGYPDFYSIQDERAYLARAVTLSAADAGFDGAAVPGFDKYPPGQGFLLAMAMWVGPDAIHAVNPIALILLAVVAAAVFREREIPEYFALLVVFHPALFLFSRTLMADLPAAAVFLTGLRLLVDRRRLWFPGALLLSLATGLRVAMAPFAGVALLWIAWHERESRVRAWLAAGFALGLAPLVYQLWVSSFFAGYAYDVGSTSLANVLPNSFRYVLSLSLIYPLMLMFGLVQRYRRDRLLKALCLLALVFFPAFPGYMGGGDAATRLVLAQRYFLFVIPLLLIGYSQLLHRRVLTSRLRAGVGLVAAFAACAVITAAHQEVLARNRSAHEAIYAATSTGALLVTDDRTAELIRPGADPRRHLNTEGREMEELLQAIDRAADVEVFFVELLREPGDQWPAGGALRQRYRTALVDSRDGEWRLRIYRLER